MADLDDLRLHRGDRVRFHQASGHRWHEGTVDAVAKDGSVLLHERSTGAARSITSDRLQVLVVHRRGSRWSWVDQRAAQPEQLSLL